MPEDNKVRTYMFLWNDRRKYIDASTYSEARREFMKKFGFWPDENLVDIQILEEEM